MHEHAHQLPTLIQPLSLLSALLLGFFSSSHCLVMCGGIAAAIGSRAEQHRVRTILMFNSGRILSYATLGLLVSFVGLWLQDQNHYFMMVMRTFAGVMLVLMGLYVGRWWLVLNRFERVGQPVWNALRPITKSFMGSVKPHHQLALGMLWGFLPCGLIYSALTWVAANGQPAMGFFTMAAFGLGTLPALAAGTLFGNIITPWLNKPFTRTFAALLLITFGLWTALAVWGHP